MTIEEVQTQVKELSVNIELFEKDEVVSRFNQLTSMINTINVSTEVAVELEKVVEQEKEAVEPEIVEATV